MKSILAVLAVAGVASFLAPAANAHPICTPLEWTDIPICIETD